VLFLGNSYTYVNDLPQILHDLALSTGDTLIFDSHTPGGYTLDQHFADSVSTGKIMAGGWDYVVLQEQSQLPAFDEYLSNGPGNLHHLISEYNPCARTLFYMTWGRKNGDQSNCAAWPPICTYEGMDNLLRLRYIEMATFNNGEVSPAGAVWRYLRQHNPGIELYQADESHPSLAGSYAAACSFYASVFRKDPAMITNDYTLPAAEADSIRLAAKAIVFDSLQQWDYATHFPDCYFTYTIGSGINEVIFRNFTYNADSYLWDFGDGDTSSQKDPVHNYAADGTYNVVLTSAKCDLGQWNTSLKDTLITFCSHTPTVFPDSLFLCPNSTDTLWTQVYDAYQWYESDGYPIQNATGQYLVPSGGSTYSVMATLNSCTEMSQHVFVDAFSTGFVIYHVDTAGNYYNTDTVCSGDTAYLILGRNKPGSNGSVTQWYADGIPVSPANDDTLMVTAAADYHVAITNPLCPGYTIYNSDTFSIVFIHCNTGIAENDMQQIVVTPNPVSDHVRITGLPGSADLKFMLMDLAGRVVLEGQAGPKIDLSAVRSGIYLLRIAGRNFKVMKAK
jgi:hypothetical protein